MADWIDTRKATIQLLKELASELDNMQKCVDAAKIVSTAGSVVSGTCWCICVVSAAFTGGLSLVVGAVATAAGGTSTAVFVGSWIGEYFYESNLMKKIQEALDRDRAKTIQMEKHISEMEQIRSVLGNTSNVVSATKKAAKHIAKKGKSEATRKLAKKFAKSAKCVGFVLNAVLLPVDIVILVDTCVKTAKGSTHVASSQIRRIVIELEQELDNFLNQTF